MTNATAPRVAETMRDIEPPVLPMRPPNIYQRKQAMIADLIGEKPDKRHGQGYMYFSIHRVRHLVAKASVAHGVDVTPEVIRTDGELACIVTLTNTDDPTDSMVKQYTFQNLPKDPANSYLTKYSYVALFHLADEEDADATMNTPPQPPPKKPATPPVNPRPDRDPVAGGSGSPQQNLLRELKERFHGDSKAAGAWCLEQGVQYRTSYLLDLPTTQATELLNKLAKL